MNNFNKPKQATLFQSWGGKSQNVPSRSNSEAEAICLSDDDEEDQELARALEESLAYHQNNLNNEMNAHPNRTSQNSAHSVAHGSSVQNEEGFDGNISFGIEEQDADQGINRSHSLSQWKSSDTPVGDLAGFEYNAGKLWIYPTNYPVREYQFDIVKKSLVKNTLVTLPTGLGKTFIASVVMYNFYRWYPEGKVVFMAPTKPLVAQQIEACYNIMGIPQQDTAEMTGSMNPTERQKAWQDRRVFFLTPQVMTNDLSRGTCIPESIKCLVIDEAHKALGNHAYCQVVRELLKYTQQFRILALSATPGSDIKSVQKVIGNLAISHIELRSEDSPDIKPYTHERTVDKIVVPLGDELNRIKTKCVQVMSVVVTRLVRQRVLYNREATSLSKFLILKAREAFRQNPPESLPRGQYGTVEGDFALAMSLYHGYELLQLHGLRSLFNFLNGILTGEKAYGRTRTELMRNADFVDIMNILREKFKSRDEAASEKDSSFITGHPKMTKLEEVVLGHFRRFEAEKQATRVMIFSQYRDSVQEITTLLQQHQPLIKVMSFIGQSSAGKATKGFTQKEQLKVMHAFRTGGYNTLVSTCVGEEGLDIGDVDLIVCFDAHKSPIRLVQRMGRTGRKRHGRIVMLMTEGKEEQIYNHSQYTKHSIHRAIMNGARSLVFYANNPRMIPEDITPSCHKMYIAVEPKQSSVKGKEKLQGRLPKLLSKAKSNPKRFTQEEAGISLEEFAELRSLGPEITAKQLPAPSMVCLQAAGGQDELEKQRNETELDLAEWLPWQNSLQPTGLLGHSRRSKHLVELLEFTDIQQLLPPEEDNYGQEMRMYLDMDDVIAAPKRPASSSITQFVVPSPRNRISRDIDKPIMERDPDFETGDDVDDCGNIDTEANVNVEKRKSTEVIVTGKGAGKRKSGIKGSRVKKSGKYEASNVEESEIVEDLEKAKSEEENKCEIYKDNMDERIKEQEIVERGLSEDSLEVGECDMEDNEVTDLLGTAETEEDSGDSYSLPRVDFSTSSPDVSHVSYSDSKENINASPRHRDLKHSKKSRLVNSETGLSGKTRKVLRIPTPPPLDEIPMLLSQIAPEDWNYADLDRVKKLTRNPYVRIPVELVPSYLASQSNPECVEFRRRSSKTELEVRKRDFDICTSLRNAGQQDAKSSISKRKTFTDSWCVTKAERNKRLLQSGPSESVVRSEKLEDGSGNISEMGNSIILSDTETSLRNPDAVTGPDTSDANKRTSLTYDAFDCISDTSPHKTYKSDSVLLFESERNSPEDFDMNNVMDQRELSLSHQKATHNSNIKEGNPFTGWLGAKGNKSLEVVEQQPAGSFVNKSNISVSDSFLQRNFLEDEDFEVLEDANLFGSNLNRKHSDSTRVKTPLKSSCVSPADRVSPRSDREGHEKNSTMVTFTQALDCLHSSSVLELSHSNPEKDSMKDRGRSNLRECKTPAENHFIPEKDIPIEVTFTSEKTSDMPHANFSSSLPSVDQDQESPNFDLGFDFDEDIIPPSPESEMPKSQLSGKLFMSKSTLITSTCSNAKNVSKEPVNFALGVSDFDSDESLLRAIEENVEPKSPSFSSKSKSDQTPRFSHHETRATHETTPKNILVELEVGKFPDQQKLTSKHESESKQAHHLLQFDHSPVFGTSPEPQSQGFQQSTALEAEAAPVPTKSEGSLFSPEKDTTKEASLAKADKPKLRLSAIGTSFTEDLGDIGHFSPNFELNANFEDDLEPVREVADLKRTPALPGKKTNMYCSTPVSGKKRTSFGLSAAGQVKVSAASVSRKSTSFTEDLNVDDGSAFEESVIVRKKPKTRKVIFDDDSKDDGSDFEESLIVRKKPRIQKISFDDDPQDSEDQLPCPATKKQKKKSKKRKHQCGFIDDEAELSDDVEVSSDENLDSNEWMEDSFINNDTQMTQASQIDMHAEYMKSVHSPIRGGGRYKLQYNAANNMNVFSQAPRHDEEESQYQEDSFCVGSDEVTDSDYSESDFEEDESVTEKRGKRSASSKGKKKKHQAVKQLKGKKRVHQLADSSSSEEEDFARLPPSQVSPAPRKLAAKRALLSSSEDNMEVSATEVFSPGAQKRARSTSCSFAECIPEEEEEITESSQGFNLGFPCELSDDDDFIAGTEVAAFAETSKKSENTAGTSVPPQPWLRKEGPSFQKSSATISQARCSLGQRVSKLSRHSLFQNQDQINTKEKTSKTSPVTSTSSSSVSDGRLSNISELSISRKEQRSIMETASTSENLSVLAGAVFGNRGTACREKSLPGDGGDVSSDSRACSSESRFTSILNTSTERGKLVVLVDSREISGAQDILSALRLEHNVHVCTRQLTACDYIVSNRMAVDRLNWSSFSNGANRKKFSQRIQQMQWLYDRCVLIVEKDRVKPGEEKNVRQTLYTKYVDSVLAQLNQIAVRVFFTCRQSETAKILFQLTTIECRKKMSLTAPVTLSLEKEQIVKFYLSIPRLTTTHAFNLCFNFKTIRDFMLSSVNGIQTKGHMSFSRATETVNYVRRRFSPALMSSSR